MYIYFHVLCMQYTVNARSGQLSEPIRVSDIIKIYDKKNNSAAKNF